MRSPGSLTSERVRARFLLRGAPLTAAALVIVATPPAFAQEDRRRGPEIETVDFRGVHAVDERELRRAIATSASECKSILLQPLCWVSESSRFMRKRYVDSVEVERDAVRIQLFYWRRGYRDAEAAVELVPTSRDLKVVFTVDEGPPTIMTGTEVRQTEPVLEADVVARAMRLETGAPLDLVVLDSTVTLLRGELWERGYADADISADSAVVDDRENVATLTLLIQPGRQARVAGIRIVGNEKVSDRTVRRLMTLRPGELFRRSAVIATQRSLYLSGLFSTVDVAASPGDTLKLIEVRVDEAALHRAGVSAGFNTVDFVQGEAEYRRYNFLGGGRRLTLRAAVGNVLAPQLNDIAIFRDVANRIEGAEEAEYLRPTWQASVDFTQPWFMSARNQLGASAFAHRRIIPGIVIDQGFGAGATFTRELTTRATTSAGYRHEVTEVDAGGVYFCVTFGICDSRTIGALGVRHALAPLSLSASIDRADPPPDPARGYIVRAELEHASTFTLSDFRYNRFVAEGVIYRPVGRRSLLAAKVRAGWVRPLASTERGLGIPGVEEAAIIQPRKRFYAGGASSVRGFAENQLGPRILTVAPGALTDSSLPNPCSPSELADGTCNPNRRGLSSDAFQPQPLGGSTLLDASVEYRFPIWRQFRGVVFVDAALVGEGGLRDFFAGTGAVTPGVGMHFTTPVGPVRLELGFRPTLVERLPVVTQVTDSTGERRLVRLRVERRYDPLDGNGGGLAQLFKRLTLHLAVGPTF